MRATAAAFALIAFAGCDWFKRLRATVHDEAPDGGGNAGIHVDVEPPDGITILLDGVRVASLSPYVARDLPAGPHQLEVRAMGFHSLTLPVVLIDGEVVKVPVRLRPRPEDTPPPTPAIERAASPRPLPPPRPPDGPGPRLPAGVKPIQLRLASEPDQSLRLDGEPKSGKELELDRTHGRMAVGAVIIRYDIGGAGLLTLTLPNDGADWSKDGRTIDPGESFRLHRGAVRLKRTKGDETQVLVIARR